MFSIIVSLFVTQVAPEPIHEIPQFRIIEQRNSSKIEIKEESVSKEPERKVEIRERDPNEPVFRPLYKEVSEQYGVPWEIIEAVHQVESGKRGDSCITSYAGAVGPMQFLPSTWAKYGVDADGNGKAEICNVIDAVYSGANYLRANGAAEGQIRKALWHYNHDWQYVEMVVKVAISVGWKD